MPHFRVQQPAGGLPPCKSAALPICLDRLVVLIPSLLCPICGSEIQLIAAVTEREPVQRILRRIGEPSLSPPITPASFPPGAEAFDWDRASGYDSEAVEPPPEFQFDQTVSWSPAAPKPRPRLPLRALRSPLCGETCSTS